MQAEQIGIAKADLYPQLSVSGSISVQANSISDLFTPESTIGSIGPSFQWNILNYGRIVNNVLLQNNLFQQALVQYQETALFRTYTAFGGGWHPCREIQLSRTAAKPWAVQIVSALQVPTWPSQSGSR